MYTVKRTIGFPFVNDSGHAIASSIPCDADFGSMGVIFGTGAGTGKDPTNGLSADAASRGLPIPAMYKGQPLCGISISPDSAIYECDIYLGGSVSDVNRRRITPLSPYVGDLDGETFVKVTIPTMMPILLTGTNILHWDAGVATALITGAGTNHPAFRLRLEFWYGTPPFPRSRGAYHAKARYSFSGAGQTGILYVCTDGRKRIVLDVQAADGTVTLSCQYGSKFSASFPETDAEFGLANIFAPAGLSVGFNRIELVPKIAAPGVSEIAPWPWIKITLTDGANPPFDHEIDVTAWD